MRARIVMLLALVIGGGCVEGSAGSEPEVATLMLHFPGNDTVLVDVQSGIVTSGPIIIYDSTGFFAEFFAEDGTPDERVTDARFRLDVTPVNAGIVTFTRGASFSGRLNKVTTGDTQIAFALYRYADSSNVFNRGVAISVN